MNLTPKARFQIHEALARQFLDIVDSEAFQRATELAMLALIEEMPIQDGAQWVAGARRFLEILKELPEPIPKIPDKPSAHKLSHDLR